MATTEQAAWIDSALAGLGRARSGPIEVFRSEPWATVSSLLCADRGRVWFKANEPCFAHEGVVLSLLAGAAPDSVLEPLAVEPVAGWFLTDDGGPLASEADNLTIAETYARIVVTSAERVDEMLALGVPDRRPELLVSVFDEACAHPEAGAAGERCAAMRDRFVRVCEVLADDGRLALADSDVGRHHAFAGPPLRLFDWADTVVTHPLVSLFHVERQLAPDAAEIVARAWRAETDGPLARAASSAARLLGADVWMRVPPEAWKRHPGGIERWVERLADALVENLAFR